MVKQSFQEWRHQLNKIQLAYWDDLPEMNLYADQVVSLINDRLVDLNVDPLTKSMINNYVKKGVIMAPVKKKYSAYQVAGLFVVVLLKNLYSISQIKAGIDQLTINNYPKVVYNRFVELLNAKLQGKEFPPHTVLVDTNECMLQLVVNSLFQRILSVQLLKEMQEIQSPITPAKK